MKSLFQSSLCFFALTCAGCTGELSTATYGSIQSLYGNWTTGCKSEGTVFAKINALMNEDATYRLETITYSDPNCTIKLLALDETGTFQITRITNTKLDHSGDLTWILSLATVRPLSVDAETSLNTSAYCGFTDWQLNIPKDIMGQTCDGKTIGSTGNKNYDLFDVATTDNPYIGRKTGDLRFGYRSTDRDGTSESRRPNSLNTNLIYRK